MVEVQGAQQADGLSSGDGAEQVVSTLRASIPSADDFTRRFAAFAGERGDVEYDYDDPSECACAQFLRDGLGIERFWVGNVFWGTHDPHTNAVMPAGVYEALTAKPRTFLALAGRLEYLIAEQSA